MEQNEIKITQKCNRNENEYLKKEVCDGEFNLRKYSNLRNNPPRFLFLNELGFPLNFSIHSVMALVIGWKLMSPISPLCLSSATL